MARLSASKIAIQDYLQKINPVTPEYRPLTPETKNPGMEEAHAAYKSYLTTPTTAPAVGGEEVMGETVSNVKEAYKKGGLLPAMLQGLGGIIKLANTSQGQTILAASQPDVFGKQAGLNVAEQTRGIEGLTRQGSANQEIQRIKSLGEYGIEEMKQKGETERKESEIKSTYDIEDQKEQHDLFMQQLELEAQATGAELDMQAKEAQINKINAEVEALKGKPAEEQKQTLAGILGKLAEKNLISPDDVKKVLAVPAEDIGKITISAPSGGMLGSLFRNFGIGRAKVGIPVKQVEEIK